MAASKPAAQACADAPTAPPTDMPIDAAADPRNPLPAAGAGKTIVLFSALYAPSMGGVETYTENLARALAQLGHRPIVATMDTHGVGAQRETCGKANRANGTAARAGVGAGSDFGAETPAWENDADGIVARPVVADEAGVEVLRLPCRNALGGRYPIPRRDGAYRNALTWLAAQGPDYVVVNTRFYPLSCEGLAFARRLGITPVLVEHGSAHLSMGGAATSKTVEAVEHAMTVRAKRYRPACFAVSKKAGAWLGHFGITSAGELPNAIDADAYANAASDRDFRTELGIDEGALLIASAGRLIPEKGVEELVQAVRMVAQRRGERSGCDAQATRAADTRAGQAGCERAGCDVQVVMAGTGPLEQRLREDASGNVHLVGRLSRPDLAALFSQADALCLPSRSEGFATTLLEAAACGLPAIVTDVGGTDELVPDERYGTILADRRPETIAAALKKAAADREKLAAQGRAVAVRVRELCSWRHTAKLTIAACEQAQSKR